MARSSALLSSTVNEAPYPTSAVQPCCQPRAEARPDASPTFDMLYHDRLLALPHLLYDPPWHGRYLKAHQLPRLHNAEATPTAGLIRQEERTG